MADHMPTESHNQQSQEQEQSGGTATMTPPDADTGDSATMAPPRKQPRPRPRIAPPRVEHLPQWKVLLHNDDVNEIGYVVETIIELIAMNPQHALLQTLEAAKTGVALLATTHRERAELLCEQFTSKRLTVTAEPDR